MKKEKTNNEWEKEFDERFKWAEVEHGNLEIHKSEIKSFIHSLFSSERHRLRENIEKNIAENQKYIDAYHYSQEDQKPYQKANQSLSEILKLLE